MKDREEEGTAEAADDSVGQDEADRQGEADAAVIADGSVDPRHMTRQQLESQLEVALAEIERLQDQSLRRQAELVNFRRRVQREQAELATVAQARLLEQVVPVIDDFERAVEMESDDARTYHEGMELMLRRLHKVLEQIGVERVEPRGEAFDPRYHEAIARQQTDEFPEGQVLDVYQPGYRLDERLIRPAAVVVSYGGEPGAAAAETDPSTTSEDVAVGEDDPGRDDG